MSVSTVTADILPSKVIMAAVKWDEAADIRKAIAADKDNTVNEAIDFTNLGSNYVRQGIISFGALPNKDKPTWGEYCGLNHRDVDLYKFTVNAGDRVSFAFNTWEQKMPWTEYVNGKPQTVTKTFSLGLTAQIFDPNKNAGTDINLEGKTGINHNDNRRTTVLEHTFHKPGTYYLGVSSYWHSGYDIFTGKEGGRNNLSSPIGPYKITMSVKKDLPEFKATNLYFDSANNDLVFDYEISQLSNDRTRPAGWNPGITFHWADQYGNTYGQIKNVQIEEHNNGTKLSFPNKNYRLRINAANLITDLGRTPTPDQINNYDSLAANPEITHIIAILNSFNNIPELDKSNNFKLLSIIPEVPKFHSNPGATKKIFLDFNSYYNLNTEWNAYEGKKVIYTPSFNKDLNPFLFSAKEIDEIREIFERVKEDFIPFNVDITTEDPGVEALRNTGGSDNEWGQRVAIGGRVDQVLPYHYTKGGVSLGKSKGGQFGIEYLGSNLVFIANILGNRSNEFLIAKQIANNITHEVGHTLGLNHDGRFSFGFGRPFLNEEYYFGHGSGQTSWAPIMGNASKTNLAQWSKGYLYSNNLEDDLSIITTRPGNGFGYRNDDHGGTFISSSPLTNSCVNGNNNVYKGQGIIEQNTDTDYFSFNVAKYGLVAINIYTSNFGRNLFVNSRVYNTAGMEIYKKNPNNTYLGDSISLNLLPGKYIISIDGGGFGDPNSSGFSDYGSLGQYFLEIIVPNGQYSAKTPSRGIQNNQMAQTILSSPLPVQNVSNTGLSMNNDKVPLESNNAIIPQVLNGVSLNSNLPLLTASSNLPVETNKANIDLVFSQFKKLDLFSLDQTGVN